MGKANHSFDMSAFSDEELVSLSREGNTSAKEALTRRFLNCKKAKNGAGYLDSEDLNQEGMLGFLNAIESYSPERGVSFANYAAVCIKHRVFDACRKVRDRLPTDSEADIQEIDAPGPGPLDSIVQTENLSRTLSACDVILSDLEKSAVFCRMSGLSYADSAVKLGVSEKSVENALSRARQKLQGVFTD